MRYTKPELLAAEVALSAIRGEYKTDVSVPDAENPDFPSTNGAYEVDE